MRKIIQISLITMFMFTMGLQRYDPEVHNQVTKEQMVAFVKEAIAFTKIYGKREALNEFNKENGLFIRGELYIFADNYDCMVLAHGRDSSLRGSDFSNLADPDRKKVCQLMVEIVKKSGKGWLKYKWIHPKSKKVMPKLAYFEKVDDNWFLGSGIYLDELDE